MKKQSLKNTEKLQMLSPEDVYVHLDSSVKGLDSSQIEEKSKIFGKNILKEKKQKPLLIKFLENFISFMALLLWVGGLIALLSGTPQLGIAIWLVNIINGCFSFFQEYRASKATEELKKLLPLYARVIRNNKENKILAEDLVPGDIMLLEEGDNISADGRIISEVDFQVNQSSLTGESTTIQKTSNAITESGESVIDLTNFVFAGTSVSSGSAKVIVSAIGMNTEFGKIAKLTQSMKDEQSHLENELNHLTKQISIFAIIIGILFFISSTYFLKQSFTFSFIFSLGMIVAFIPEGLLPTVTLSLAKAVQQLAKEHALVKKLSSVETLGSTSVICSDKTGTLTKNEMTVCNIWTNEQSYNVTGTGYSSNGGILTSDGGKIDIKHNERLQFLLQSAALCSNATVIPPNNGDKNYKILGDPTEACLNVLAEKAGINLNEIKKWAERIHELPFDSVRKRMTTVHELNTTTLTTPFISITKGAPKEMVSHCSRIFSNGNIKKLSNNDISKIMDANDFFARQGLRVLAVAYNELKDLTDKPSSWEKYTIDSLENDMIFQGLIVMSDPPRDGIEDEIRKCHKAGIRTIMVTGDYGLTASSIAKKIKMVEGENPKVITGEELKIISDDKLKEALKEEIIFARVAPEQKYRIVTTFQTLGYIVAVTGDGVNDAPALKKADIGIAMGITGTDVAKESADMILTDDNFASIVNAIERGRAVYSNIQKFLVYIFNSNTAEAAPSGVFLFSKCIVPLPLTVMQILAIDLGTDMVPAIGLGSEKPEKEIMEQTPRKKDEPLFNFKLFIRSFLWYGLMESIIAIGAFFFSYALSGITFSNLTSYGSSYQQATTMTLGAIIFCQIGMVLNCRTEKVSLFKIKIFSNRTINLGIIIEIILFISLVYIPFLQKTFNTFSLSIYHWVYLLFCPVLVILIEEIRKNFLRSNSVSISNN